MFFVLGFHLNDKHLSLQFAFTFGLILAFSLVLIPHYEKTKIRLKSKRNQAG